MTSTQNIPSDRLAGSVLGLAYFDAYGDPYEFQRYEAIKESGAPAPSRFRVTDDTQMSLSVWAALDAWSPEQGLGALRLELDATFRAWLHDPDNDRAPGVTCMSALHKLEQLGLGSWAWATSPTSAGCGSVMRAPWVGLHSKVADDMVGRVAALQAVLTHGPAESPYCAAALAELTRAIARGEVVPGEAAAWVDAWVDVHVIGAEYDWEVLGGVHEVVRPFGKPGAAAGLTPSAYIAEGLGHVVWVADTSRRLTERLDSDGFWSFDPCEVAGEGWRARETVALAVGIFDAMGGELTVVDAARRAAMTNGDSDSIGAITGALVGAHFGVDGFPTEWFLRLESRYQVELAGVAGLVRTEA